MRVFVTLACTECKNRNYHSTKNKKSTERLEMKKLLTEHIQEMQKMILDAKLSTPTAVAAKQAIQV